ncbi:GNAT family N-acetyltransferase [Ciceribacter sp. L1K23]|uniref:GNAT family N-acetyltransferase n=1 Tax=Ciceribacter sp. L1K23 TaxID=2820276 RepID=UPI001B83D5CD|nr:GNAT family N-acetyltransferase [Ciceribacter sp. L1K23]MBR0557105.1 GNAT family N-acetyltransferase [Ciceribacter sp. L1K23]
MITTERLELRRPDMEDFEAYAAMWSDPEVLRHISPKGFSQEEIWGRFLRQAGGWHYMGYGYLTVTERASGRMVGQVGFQDLKRDIKPSLAGTLEAGWTFLSAVRGRGYASEAAMALFDWGSANFAGRRATAIISPENSASLKIAGKVGLKPFARSSYHERAVIMFERVL